MKQNILPTKKGNSNLNGFEILFKNNNNDHSGRFSINEGKGDNNIDFVVENYKNILTNSRITNSFGNITEEKLLDFYSFDDDF